MTNYEYTVSLSVLSSGTTYYYQVVAIFGDFTLRSDIGSFETDEKGS